MARRSSYSSKQRQQAQAQSAAEKQWKATERASIKAARDAERAKAADERERKRLYVEDRMDEVAAMNEDLDAQVRTLENLLVASLDLTQRLDFADLKQEPATPKWEFGYLETPELPPALEAFLPTEPSALGKLFGKGKHEQAVASAHAAHRQVMEEHRAREANRVWWLEKNRADWQSAAAAAEVDAAKQHAEVDQFAKAFFDGDPDAVVSYGSIVLSGSPYPEGFPLAFKLAYVPESRQLVCEYQLPTVDVVPAVKTYKYVKATDSVTETPRPATQIKTLYASVVAQTTLRTVHELFSADGGRHVDTVVVNGVVDTTHPGTGQSIRPCLITLRTTRDAFSELDLSRVDPHACLKFLSAGVSKDPAELAPVRPVLEFDMVDPRFIAEMDALSTLESRPNLMELTPTEFEALIQNLFTKMGLESRLTRASRDGGVDCVAYDPRPIMGGKVVIQAKRYRHTVGVSAVRDLFGTLQNEGASKGILVTTSGYGSASFEFAQGKPIELIDGAQLLYLLSEHAGIQARIVPPEEWADPIPDSPGSY